MCASRLAVHLLLLFPAVAGAHEFWIEPRQFQVPGSEHIVADLRVGEYFKGNSQVYLPQSFVSFTVTDGAGTRPVDGTPGDLPAGKIPTKREGLHVIAYQSTPSSISYETLADLEDFADKQGLEWVVGEHRRRGLPETDITESYTRFAKSLVQVGGGSGRDRAVGLPFELVARTSPYTSIGESDITVKLLWRGEPHADAQITVFRKRAGCKTTRTTVQTDGKGLATVPGDDGGRLLVNAVHMKEPSQRVRETTDALWHSLWTSLTFKLPVERPAEQRPDCEPERAMQESAR